MEHYLRRGVIRLVKHYNGKLIGIFIGLIAVLQALLLTPLLFSSSNVSQSQESPQESPETIKAAYLNWESIADESTREAPRIQSLTPTTDSTVDAPVNPYHDKKAEDLIIEQEQGTPSPSAPTARTYTVRTGDTLSRIWNKHGGETALANRAAAAFRKAGVPLSSLRAGEEIALTVSSTGIISELKKELSNGRVLLLRLNENAYEPQIIEPEIITTRRIASGTIDHSLATSSLSVGIPYEIIDEFIDLFSGRIEFSRDTQPGDSFTVIYEERSIKNGKALAPGVIHAASFMNRGDLVVAVRHVDSNDEPRYYDRQGKAIGNHFLRYPVKFTRISSLFNKGRFHPVLKRRRPHHGVDFAAPTGTPVRTVADGIVEKAGYYGGNGNMVKIKHGSKYASAYVHLSKISKGIRAGTRVKRGQVIGAVGSTGLATGPHLHYAFYVNGRYVDPMKIKLPQLPNSYEPIPAEFLQKTLSELEHQHEQVQIAYSSKGQQSVSGGV